MTIQATGGAGGSASSGQAGNGGTASIGNAFVESTDGTADLNATVVGGNGGNGNGTAVSGNGYSIALDNVIDGEAANGILRLNQRAVGGSAGGGFSGLTGESGSATSQLNVDKAAGFLQTTANAAGGQGGSVGGNATANNISQNTTNGANIVANATAGDGDSGGQATAFSEGTVGFGSVGVNSFANGGDSSVLAGGSATSESIAVHSDSGDASASSTSNGGEATQPGLGGNANATSNTIVQGAGTAQANAAAWGGIGRGQAVASAWAESGTLAISSANEFAGDGVDGNFFREGQDGLDLTQGIIASGSAGESLSVSQLANAGDGGSAGNDNIVVGNGGNASSSYISNDVNVGDGENVELTLRANGGFGGDRTGDLDSGNGGSSSLEIAAFDSGNFDSNSFVTAGNGGDVSPILNGTGNGGFGGEAIADIQVGSTGSGDVSASLSTIGGAGGDAPRGDAGRGGDATGNLAATSNGGLVTASNFLTAGRGGDSDSFFESQRSGDGGNAFSSVVATTTMAEASAFSTAIAGQTGISNNDLLGTEGTASSIAIANNRFTGTNAGGIATAHAVAQGLSGMATATAISGNSIFENLQVETITPVSNRVDALSVVGIGDHQLTLEDLRNAESGGYVVASPDTQTVESFLEFRNSQELLSTFVLSLIHI